MPNQWKGDYLYDDQGRLKQWRCPLCGVDIGVSLEAYPKNTYGLHPLVRAHKDSHIVSSTMKPEILGPTEWWEVDTVNGTYYVQCEYAGYGSDAIAMTLLPYLDVTDTSQIMKWEFRSGYGARLSMPGFLDCTDWTVHDTEKEAKKYLCETWDLCEVCMETLQDNCDCDHCMQNLTEDEIDNALVEIVREMTPGELVGYPEVYRALKDVFIDDMLSKAYQMKVLEAEKSDE